MRLLEKMCFVVLASGLALGQATAPNSGSAGSGSVSDELKALREAISQQQQQIAQQQQQIQTLQQKLQDEATTSSSVHPVEAEPQQPVVAGKPHVANASLNTTPVSATATMTQETQQKESPLSFRIGGTEFTPGGFVDFENVFRTTNSGGVSARAASCTSTKSGSSASATAASARATESPRLAPPATTVALLPRISLARSVRSGGTATTTRSTTPECHRPSIARSTRVRPSS